MSNPYYPHLFEPLKIRNYILKNRMGMPRATPVNFVGYGEDPLESFIAYFAMQAHNGAAIVTAPSGHWDDPNSNGSFFGSEEFRNREIKKERYDKAEMNIPLPDAYDSHSMREMEGSNLGRVNPRILFARVAEAVRAQDTLPAISMMEIEPNGWRLDDIPAEYLDQMCENFAKRSQLYRDLGFCMGVFYMSYRNSLLAQSMSPELNHRTDKYAGPTALSRAVFGAVRKACGDDFLIEIQISGEELTPDGFKIEDVVDYVKGVEDLIDVVQLRSADAHVAHPLGWNSEKGVYDTMRFARALKEAGVKPVIAPVGGYQDPDYNEMAVANGWCDMVYMARAFICDSHYGEKVAQGRKEDIIPCARCNKCHHKPWIHDAGCTVNPEFSVAWDHNITKYFPENPVSKKLAVIGGGPAGMRAALTAAERGHKVTLFEKTGVLGGQLTHADYADFKWPLRDFKDYLIAQLEKSGVEVRMNAAPTAEQLKTEGFEAVFAAMGSAARKPNIPGKDNANVYTPMEVYGREQELGENVVVIGGSETAVETGMYLARAGHKVFLISRQDRLAKDAQPVHYIETVTRLYNEEPNFDYIKYSTTTEIGENYVRFVDDDGEHIVECDSVVLCGGVDALQDEAMELMRAFAPGAVRVIGDCRKPGDVRYGLKSAYIAAMMLG